MERLLRFTADGIAYSVRPTRSSVDVLLVATPGNGLCKECFDDFVDAVPEQWAVQIDLTGHGASRGPTPEWEDDEYLYRYGLDIIAVIDAFAKEFGTPRFKMAVAHSMGAKASLWAQIQRAGVFDAFVLVEPIAFPPRKARTAAERQKEPFHVMTLKRKNAFASPEAVVQSFTGRGIFARWTPSTLKKYATHGFKRDEATSGVVLACKREWEARNFAANDNTLYNAALSVVRPSALCVVVGKDSTNLDGFPGYKGTVAYYDAMCADFKCDEIVVPNATHSLPFEAPGIAALVDIVRRKIVSTRGSKL